MKHYDIWFIERDEEDRRKSKLFICGIPGYQLASAIVANLEMEFGVDAWIEGA